MTHYTPRRQSRRWLDGDCPAGVLAIYDNGGATFDRFTVFYRDTVTDDRGTVWIGYRGMSEHPAAPQGFGIYGEMPAHEARAYRYTNSHRAARWSELPPDVQTAVRRDCQPSV